MATAVAVFVKTVQSQTKYQRLQVTLSFAFVFLLVQRENVSKTSRSLFLHKQTYKTLNASLPALGFESVGLLLSLHISVVVSDPHLRITMYPPLQ